MFSFVALETATEVADNSSRVECFCKCLLAMRTQFWAANSARSTINPFGLHCARRGNLADALTAQRLVKPSALHSSEPTPLCTKNNPVGSYFFFTEASRG